VDANAHETDNISAILFITASCLPVRQEIASRSFYRNDIFYTLAGSSAECQAMWL
jgi:hypothetical protein